MLSFNECLNDISHLCGFVVWALALAFSTATLVSAQSFELFD
jgi:hypothetical protein